MHSIETQSQQAECRPERVQQFLQFDLSHSEQSQFETHLSDCAHCRALLEHAAASTDIWGEIRESLSSETAEQSAAPFDFAASGDEPFAYSDVLEHLAPSDDERMLGRVGGYEVVGMVGVGGMGVVLKAFDPSLNRYVAIKLLAPHLAGSGAARKRFAREAQAAAAVVHDNVVEIHGVDDVNGLPYLVMPYLRGPSLQKRLDDDGPLAVTEILRIAKQAAAGLAEAHAQGLVHRDVKPANILLADGVERAKLTDFGLARAVDDASLTRTGVIAGTPQYMSPEQARGDSVDATSDLFSLGSVMYAMCTGRPPFRADTSYGVLRRITDTEPRPIRDINPDIPVWLATLVAKLMAKHPSQRFHSAAEVAGTLETCLAHVQQPGSQSLPDLLAADDKPRRSPTMDLENDSTNFPRRITRWFAVMAAFAAGLLGILFVLELNKGTLTIESDADDIAIRIMHGTDVVKKLRVTQKNTSVRLAAGNYVVDIDGQVEGMTVQNGVVELKRGGGTVVRIVQNTPNAKASPPEAATFHEGASQFKFVAPVGMKIDCETAERKRQSITCPGRLNLARGKTHQLVLSNVASAPGYALDARLEVSAATPETLEFLSHNAIPIEFTEDDFRKVFSERLVTKVIFLPKSSRSPLRSFVTTQLPASGVSLAGVQKKGTIVAVLRCGTQSILDRDAEQRRNKTTRR